MSQVFFRKEREDEDTVVYAFGEDRGDLKRTLTVHKGADRCTPDDGVADHTFGKAVLGIVAARRREGQHGEGQHGEGQGGEGRWPERGYHASC